eukprot:977479_1
MALMRSQRGLVFMVTWSITSAIAIYIYMMSAIIPSLFFNNALEKDTRSDFSAKLPLLLHFAGIANKRRAVYDYVNMSTILAYCIGCVMQVDQTQNIDCYSI